MARDVMDTELGYAISDVNGGRQVYIISGTAVPDGVTGQQSAAPIGSLYLRSGTGELYQKIANAGAPADYQLNDATGSSIGNWRPERVDAHTGQVLTAGNTDPTTWSDNDDGTDDTAFTIGHYVLDGNCDLWEITGISTPNLTLAAAGTAPATDDMFAVKFNMPDPAGQENQAIITFDGVACIKVADVDFASATGISLVAPYTPVNGDPIAGDSVQGALEKLDGNQDDLQTLSGTAQGSTTHGAMDQGEILSDNATTNALLKETDAELTRQRGKFSATGVTTAQTVDSVLVDEVAHCTWKIVVEDATTPANKKSFDVSATHNGHAAADATDVDFTVSKILRLGSNFNVDTNVNVNLTGASQIMQLRFTSTEPSGVNIYVKRIEVLF